MDEQPEFNFEAKSKILYKCKVFAFYACFLDEVASNTPLYNHIIINKLKLTKNMNIKRLTLLILSLSPVVASAQNITHTAESADLTFFYDPTANVGERWDFAFRAKSGGPTVATGLTNPSPTRAGSANGPFPGSNQDFQFDSLTYVIGATTSVSGDPFYLSSYGGTGSLFDQNATTPDIGIRTRLNNADVAFSTFTLTLDSFSGPGDLIFLDTIFNFIYDSRGGIFDSSTVWYNNVNGHDHFHFGFSEMGSYALNFIVNGTLSDSTLADTGSLTVNFEVIPEPSQIALFFGLGAFGAILLLRNSRRKKVIEANSSN
jgi:hypothetical protein